MKFNDGSNNYFSFLTEIEKKTTRRHAKNVDAWYRRRLVLSVVVVINSGRRMAHNWTQIRLNEILFCSEPKKKPPKEIHSKNKDGRTDRQTNVRIHSTVHDTLRHGLYYGPIDSDVSQIFSAWWRNINILSQKISQLTQTSKNSTKINYN